MRNLRSAFIIGLTVSLSLGASASAQSGRSSKRGALSSRGSNSLRALPPLGTAQKVIETQLVMGRVGVVRVPSVTLRAGRASGDKPLAVVTEGTNLAVLMEKEGYYGVLMQDSTMGWVMTGAVEMLDYRVQVKLSKAVPPPEPEEPTESQTETAPETTLESQTSDPRVAATIRESFTYLGVPYVWAGNTRRGLDCSAFVKNVFSATRGVSLPRHSGDQARVGTPVASTDDLQPGDRLYFDMGKKGRVSHCGIYLGNGYFIHASSNRHCVGVDKLTSGNYWGGLVAARRDP
ncbi:MAG: C40 family peptidase [Akkermansiaceae bacterium]|nr:C40 family peptidase [Armatimonadota bacterium]